MIRLVSPKKVTPRCIKHNKSLKLYCESGEELICIYCTVHIHRDHHYVLISDTYENHKEEILISLKLVKKRLEATNIALDKIDKRHKEIVAGRVAVETQIHADFDNIRMALDALEAELVAQLERHTQEQSKNLLAQRDKMEILQTQFSNCAHSLEDSICNGSPGDLVKMKAGVVKQVRELVGIFESDMLEPCEQTSANFTHSALLATECQKLGTVYKITFDHVPSRRMRKSHSQLIANLQTLDDQQDFRLDPSLTEAQLISRLTDQTTKCVLKERGKGKYKFSYQPTVGGIYLLNVKVGGEEVIGSPFSVTLKTPINKLGALIKTVDGIRRPKGVAVNKSGEVIMAEGESSCLLIYSAVGDKIQEIDTQSTAAVELKDPYGIAVDSENNILVVDRGRCQLLKFSRGGNLLAAVGSNGNGPGQFSEPYSVCVNNVNEKVYVVDHTAHCVHIFNSDLTFCSKFGRKAKGNGQFDYPYDIASDSTGCVFVTDTSNWRVQVFTPDGGYLRQFRREREGVFGFNPGSICIDNDGLVYIGEMTLSVRVCVFTNEGECLKWFGPTCGSGPGRFHTPTGMAVGNGVLYVCDGYNDRLLLF